MIIINIFYERSMVWQTQNSACFIPGNDFKSKTGRPLGLTERLSDAAKGHPGS